MREHNNLPATFNYRVSAFSIDYGSVLLVMLIAIFMQIHPEYGQYIKMLITVVFWYLLNISISFKTPGLTIGKKINKIRVVNEDYSEVSIGRMHVRETFIFLVTILSGGLYIFISYLLMESRVDKRAIHDLLFKTRVIRTTPFVGKTE